MKTFRVGERLKSRKTIDILFKKGQSFGQFPLRLVYMPMENRLSEHPIQFSVSVPKRKFPKAVHRTKIKRLVREAYRLNKSKLYRRIQDQEHQMAIMIIYVGKEIMTYAEIELAMKQLLGRFSKKLRKQFPRTNPSD